MARMVAYVNYHEVSFGVEQSGAQVAVQGRTVSILGSLAAIEAAQISVGMLLGGAEHGSVYHYLEGHRRRR